MIEALPAATSTATLTEQDTHLEVSNDVSGVLARLDDFISPSHPWTEEDVNRFSQDLAASGVRLVVDAAILSEIEAYLEEAADPAPHPAEPYLRATAPGETSSGVAGRSKRPAEEEDEEEVRSTSSKKRRTHD